MVISGADPAGQSAMPRLFYAIDLPAELKDELAPSVMSLRDLGRHVRPVGRHAFHLTLLFLGEQPATALEDFVAFGHDAVAPARPCKLALGPSGFFPRVSFLTLTGETETLMVISSVLHETCASYMERPDDRPFKAHITLARLKKKLRPSEKGKIAEAFAKFEGRSWVADELILFQSDLTPKGAIYTVIERFPFSG